MSKRPLFVAICAVAALAMGVSIWIAHEERIPAGTEPTRHAQPADDAWPAVLKGDDKAPAPSHRPKDFWASRDRLFELYRAGVDSTDAKLRYMAREALNVCLPFAMKQPFPEAANRDAGTNAAELARTRAILERACVEFSAVPAPTLIRQRTQLNDWLQNAELPPSIAELPRAPTEEDIHEARHALKRGLDKSVADGLLWLAPALSSWIEWAAGTHPGTLPKELRDATHVGTAVLLSQCSLGYDCGPSSFPYLHLCSSAGLCAGSLEAYFLNGLDAGQQELVRRQAALIARSIEHKDLAALGL
jgi:hypothetical protein